jgi:hypothetical protein
LPIFSCNNPNALMRHTPTDDAARAAQLNSGERHRAGFESTLPHEARTELERPKRPVMLRTAPAGQAPTVRRRSFLPWAIGFAAGALAWAAIVSLSTSHTGQPQAAAVAIPTPTPVPLSTPAATTAIPSRVAPTLAPRARLVRMPTPTPRATLVRLPELVTITPEHIDEAHTVRMPYGEDVRATLRGFLDSENQLSRAGRVGDIYVVGKVPWIWVTVPGTASPTWVDP